MSVELKDVMGLAGAAQVVAAKGGSIISLAPAGLNAVRPRTVVHNFSDPNGTYMSFTSGTAAYTVEALPTPAPSGQMGGGKLVVTGANGLQGYARSYTFAAATSGGNVPATSGMKPFAKATNQIMYVVVYVDGDAYQTASTYADTVVVVWEKDAGNKYTYFFNSSSISLKAGFNTLIMRWDASNVDSERVPTITGAIADGDMLTRVQVGLQAGNGSLTIRPVEAGYFSAPPAKPLIMLTFDGYYTAHQNLVMPLLKSKGVPGCFTTGVGYWWNDPSLPLTLATNGFEVGQQVYKHIDYPQAGDVAYANELDLAIGYMKALGLSWQTQSMPYNDITKSQVAIAGARGVRMVCEGRQVVTPIMPWGLGAGKISGAYAIGRGLGTDNKTLANARTFADAAVRYGGLVCLTIHELIAGGDGVATTGNATQTFVNDLSAFIDYAKSIGCTFTTPGELIRSLDAMAVTVN